jgi:hypothetical protein
MDKLKLRDLQVTRLRMERNLLLDAMERIATEPIPENAIWRAECALEERRELARQLLPLERERLSSDREPS